ncbi:bifunctional helix-turn-helix transcriptional regulator/GNAT family N-acetyltransferase [Ensifer soli]|uniref:bifunctional helix-turn-helix transcriptional regulator/GNAT family N-acetyltransferase n=1 Tax=Ciceribacter sp. sgz301302 TaxID=3342379 RepID=UPI0035B76918
MPLDTIDSIRAFNRDYTRWLGLLDRAYLDGPYTLTEARILYELANRDGLAASLLIEELHLDAAYLSRILKAFRGSGLVESRPDPGDQRRQILSITEKGRAEAADLAHRSRAAISASLEDLAPAGRERLAGAMQAIRDCLGKERRDPQVVLRPHRVGDVARIVHRQAILYAGEYGWNGEYEALALEIAARFLRDFKPGREACHVAEREGEIVGAVFLVEDDAETGRLRLLHVEREARGLGVGRLLVRACIASARAAGYRRLTLWTNDVLAAARRLYESEGFRLVSEERHRSFGKDLNGQVWSLDLDG